MASPTPNLASPAPLLSPPCSSPRTKDGAWAVVLVLVAAPLFLWNLGRPSLMGDEGFFAEAARGAAGDGHWLPLTLRGETFISHPPLKVWLQALVYLVVGESELSSRLVDVVAGMAALLLVFRFGRQVFDRGTGFLAALVLLTAHGYVFDHGVRAGVLDSLLVLLM